MKCIGVYGHSLLIMLLLIKQEIILQIQWFCGEN